MKKEKIPDPNRLPVGKFFAWKSRDVSIAGVSVIITMFLTMYCTDVLQMPAALVGTLLLATKVCDGITDLFAGYIVDNTKTRFGKGRPYEFCILGVWLCTLLLFSVPPELSIVVKSVWVFIMYTFIFSIFQTLLNAAQTPYLIRAFPNRTVVIKLSSYGGIITMLGSVSIAATFPVLMAKVATSAAGWSRLVAVFGIPLAVIGILRFFFVKETIDIDMGKTEKVKLKEIFKMLGTNKYAWFYTGVFGLFQFINGLAVGSYYFKYIIRSIGMMATMQMVSIAILLVMFIFPKMLKKMSIANLIIFGAVLAVVGFTINFFAYDRIPLLLVGGILAAFVTLPISYLQGPMIMDLAAYNQWKGLPRMEATTAVLFSFGGKVLNGAGTGLLGILLGAAGYDGSLTQQPENAILMIRILMSLIPAATYIGVIVFAKLLDGISKKMPEINQANSAKMTSQLQA
jgi:Na+/melibiose symporter-like transporter